jgi:site-specific DNA recombinase
MKRVGIYGRFSHDASDERSNDDQIQYCRKYAAGQPDWTVVKEFRDEAISGSAFKGRKGVQAAIQALLNKEIDILLAEHTDRISRRAADMSALMDEAEFHGFEIWGVNQGGKLTKMTAGMHAVMAQEQREETGRKVHRGMKPKFERDGLHMGGRPYGYHLKHEITDKLSDKGRLLINEDEAEVIRRIFKEFFAGSTPRQIAQGLNKEGIPAPRSGRWNASTINGMKARGTGILNNTLYVGRPIWNKNQLRKVVGDAKKRVIRPRDKSEHATRDEPGYRIVDEETFYAVQRLKDERAHVPPPKQRKAKRLLSGLLRCGCCGSGISVKGRDKTGKMRIQCSRHHESRDCPDPIMTYVDVVERKVIDTVVGLFSSPEDINVLLKNARAEARKDSGDKLNERSKLERRLGELNCEVEKLTDLLLRGVGVETVLDQRVKAAYAEKTNIEAKLEGLGDDQSDNVISIHPAALKKLLNCATQLREMMERGDMEGDHALSEAFRFFLHSVVVHKVDGWRKDPAVEIFSPWMAFNASPPTATASSLSGGLMVAEEGFEPPTQGL